MNLKTIAALKELIYLSAADLIIAASVYFLLVPSHAAIASISAVAMLLTNVIPLPLSYISMILNVILLIIGFFTCGKEFGGKTVYTSILLSIYLWIFEVCFPNFQSLTGDATLDVVCYIICVSVGLAMLFNHNASSGGLDIIEKLMNKYLHIELGKAMTILGIAIGLSSFFFYDTKTMILSLLGTYFNGMILDRFIFGQSLKRRVCIISDKQEEIRQWLIHDLHSGATMYEAIGAYNLEKRRELVTIVDRNEYQKLMAYLRKTDPKAFITVYTVSDIQYVVKNII